MKVQRLNAAQHPMEISSHQLLPPPPPLREGLDHAASVGERPPFNNLSMWVRLGSDSYRLLFQNKRPSDRERHTLHSTGLKPPCVRGAGRGFQLRLPGASAPYTLQCATRRPSQKTQSGPRLGMHTIKPNTRNV